MARKPKPEDMVPADAAPVTPAPQNTERPDDADEQSAEGRSADDQGKAPGHHTGEGNTGMSVSPPGTDTPAAGLLGEAGAEELTSPLVATAPAIDDLIPEEFRQLVENVGAEKAIFVPDVTPLKFLQREATIATAGSTGLTLRVTGPKKGRWRIGRRFTAEPVDIPLDDLTEAECAALRDDPTLNISVF